MYTVETVLDSLKKFKIDEITLENWEQELGLDIPVDEYGRKQYSPHHVNLFKNVKKHLALGRTLAEISQIIALPPEETSKPSKISSASTGPSKTTSMAPRKPYASVPQRPEFNIDRTAEVVQLIYRLMNEKDDLHRKLIETEKLNSHLYNANNMFHRKVKELNAMVTGLKKRVGEDGHLKLLNEKSQLQAQMLEAEKLVSKKNHESEIRAQELASLRVRTQDLEERLAQATVHFNPRGFCGDWVEDSKLIQIVYDNFGINIDTERHRIFRISQAPERVFGNMMVIATDYEYETNQLWKRYETLSVAFLREDRLEGELTIEYSIDGVPVAKALYRVVCNRRHK